MALSDDIDQIKAMLLSISLGQDGVLEAITELSDKIDGIKSSSSGNSKPKLEIYSELMSMFRLLAAGKKMDAGVIVRELTGCSGKEAMKLVEIIDVADHD